MFTMAWFFGSRGCSCFGRRPARTPLEAFLKQRLFSALGGAAMAMIIGFGALGAQTTAPPVPPAPTAPTSPAAGGYRANSPEYGMSVFVYGNKATTERDLAKLQA